MDITPAIPAGRQIVESYGEGGFRVSGTRYAGSVLVLPGQTLAWPVTAAAQLDLPAFAPLIAAGADVEILLLGCGTRMALVAPELRRALRAEGMTLEPMDTGAACRTYNVLMAEGRRVAAALIAVP
jgi:uncharacterized protein